MVHQLIVIAVIDFGILDQGEHNYVSRGGNCVADSSERVAQEQREATSLMVIYTSMVDIPPSPREPPDMMEEDFAPEQAFGSPTEVTKAREAQYYSSKNSQSIATFQPPAQMSSTPDISALLKMLNNPQQPAPQSQPAPAIQAQPSGLEAIFAQFANPNQQAPQAPMPLVQQPPQTSGYDLGAVLAAIAPVGQGQNSYGAPHQQAPTPNVASTPDLQSILAQIGGPQAPNPSMQGYGYQNSYQSDNDRKRQYDYDQQASNDYSSNYKKQKGEKKKYTGKPLYPCRYWQEGKCKKGDQCTYLHEER